MAIVHRATLTPSKMELLEQWLPSQQWFSVIGPSNLVRVGSFRFDDPDGEVGIETLLVVSAGAVFQIPLTYRGSPLRGADQYLVGTMEHCFLGTRWIYDAPADPVYVSALAASILTGQPQADQYFEVDGQLQLVPESVYLHTTGTPGAEAPVITSAVPRTDGQVTTIRTGDMHLSINRRLNPVERSSGQKILAATWAEQTTPVQLATAAKQNVSSDGPVHPKFEPHI